MRNVKKVAAMGMLCGALMLASPIISNATTYLPNIPKDGYMTSQDITLTWSNSNIASVMVNNQVVQNGYVISTNGEHNIEVLDGAGQELEHVTVYIDKKAPVIKGVEDGAYYTTKDGIEIDVDDMTNCTAMLNDEPIEAVEDGIFVDEQGSYNLIVTDSVGHVSQVKFVIDYTKPSISGVKNNKYYKKKVKVKFNDKQTGVQSATLNGKTIKSGKTVSKHGTYKLVVKDTAGNQKTIKFTIDKKKPTIKFKVINRYSVQVTVTDSSGIKKITVDGKKKPIRKQFSMTMNRPHTVTVTDKAGNKVTKTYKP